MYLTIEESGSEISNPLFCSQMVRYKGSNDIFTMFSCLRGAWVFYLCTASNRASLWLRVTRHPDAGPNYEAKRHKQRFKVEDGQRWQPAGLPRQWALVLGHVRAQLRKQQSHSTRYWGSCKYEGLCRAMETNSEVQPRKPSSQSYRVANFLVSL